MHWRAMNRSPLHPTTITPIPTATEMAPVSVPKTEPRTAEVTIEMMPPTATTAAGR